MSLSNRLRAAVLQLSPIDYYKINIYIQSFDQFNIILDILITIRVIGFTARLVIIISNVLILVLYITKCRICHGCHKTAYLIYPVFDKSVSALLRTRNQSF